jgi:hypothetical protein
MNDKMAMITEWLRSLGKFYMNNNKNKILYITDEIFNLSILQTGVEFDSIEQLQIKLKRYATEIESLRIKGISK